MEKISLLYEGRAKKVFTTEDEDLLLVEYKDEITEDGELSLNGANGGTINNRMTNILCKLLEKEGIDTHYVQELSDTETVVKKAEIIPLEIVIRNIASGSFSKKLGIEEGLVLLEPTKEFYYKNIQLGDPMIDSSYALAVGAADREEIKKITELAFQINEILKEKFHEIGIDLVDLELEFGRYKGQIILTDQISPYTCRLWEMGTGKRLGKGETPGEVRNAYEEVLRKLV